MDSNGIRVPAVYILTLNWNGGNDTAECVASLKQLDYPNYRIVVIDNGSTDNSVQTLKEKHPDVSIIENGRNLGYALGFNSGLRYAYDHGADYFLIINNDTVVEPGMLAALVQVADTDDRIGFVSGKVYFFDEPNRLQTAGRLSHPVLLAGTLVGWNEIDRGQYDQVKEYDFLDDIYLLVRRQAFEATGGYDSNFFLYYEETDWCVRVRKAGYKLVYTPEARIWHRQGRSTGGLASPRYVYFMSRNQVVFVRRNACMAGFIRYLWHLAISSPRQLASYAKYGKYELAKAYIRGTGSGLLWAFGPGKAH